MQKIFVCWPWTSPKTEQSASFLDTTTAPCRSISSTSLPEMASLVGKMPPCLLVLDTSYSSMAPAPEAKAYPFLAHGLDLNRLGREKKNLLRDIRRSDTSHRDCESSIVDVAGGCPATELEDVSLTIHIGPWPYLLEDINSSILASNEDRPSFTRRITRCLG